MKERKIPMRRCIGCGTSKEKNSLIRIVCYEGNVSLDTTGRAKGRGAYLCRDNNSCWEKAFKKKAFERSLGVTVPEEDKAEILKQLSRLNEQNDQ